MLNPYDDPISHSYPGAYHAVRLAGNVVDSVPIWLLTSDNWR